MNRLGMSTRTRLSTWFILGISAYLGFYVFGLVMGAYSPGDVLYFTIPALIFVVMLIGTVIAFRRSGQRRADDDELSREARHWRETRGF
jgi:hypothetical protein